MSAFNGFSTNKTTSDVKNFFESNSLVSKFIFLLLVIFIFILLLRLGIILISKIFITTNGSPHLINGMIDARQQTLAISQNPNESGSNTVYRSINASDGIEFTWSVWIFINELQYNAGQFKHIFHKGNFPNGSPGSGQTVPNGLAYPNNAPGLYIAPNTNELLLIMNTFNDIIEEITIPDIPLNKWLSVIIRCQNTTLDVYINGTISRSLELSGVPKQNYGDVYVALHGGFDGYISNLWYYDHALGTAAIQRLVRQGASTSISNSDTSNVSVNIPDYLSLKWYFAGTNNLYNS
jgi:hypothetical protein